MPSHTSPAPPSHLHTSSSSACSSDLQAGSGFSSSSPSDLDYLNLNFAPALNNNLAASSTADLISLGSSDKDDYYSQPNVGYSSASVNYRPVSGSAADEFNTTIRDQSESQSQGISQPFPSLLQHPRNRHSRQSSGYNIDTDLFDSLNSTNPIQEAYRCLTTPSALHPSPSLAPHAGSFGSRNNQRQSSCSSPSKNYKQQQTHSQPQFLQKPYRNSQQHPSSSLGTPLHQHHLPIRTSSPILSCVPIEALIQLDIQYSSGTSNAIDAAVRLTQLLIYYSVVNRLQSSTQAFLVSQAERLKSDPAKFSSPYLQSIDFCSSILKHDFNARGTNFMSSLKSSNRRLLNQFISLVKTSPSFICASLSTMNDNDVFSLFAPASNDPLDDLNALHRGNALDIIFYSLFPSTAPSSQRFEYFSFIVTFIFDHYTSTEKYDKLCLAIFDRILSLSSMNHLASLENILLGFLQNGQFLLNYSLPPFSIHSPPPVLHPINLGSPGTPLNSMPSASSAPNSTYPSPEMPAMSLANNSPSHSMPFASMNVGVSPSISLQRTTAKPTTSTATHNHNSKASSNSFHLIDPDFEQKRLDFLNDAISQFLSRLNNTSTEAIPDHLLYFYKLVLSKVCDNSKDHALHFIFFRHFLNKYIFSFFNSPESLGLAADFFITEKQRQRILLVIYQTLLYYAEVVILNKPCTSTVPPDIQSLLISIYDKLSSDTVKSSTTASTANTSTTSELDEHASEAGNTDFLHSLDGHAPGGVKNCSGQLLVLCPSDVLTLYASLFPSFAIQRKASFASHTSAPAKPISVERSGSSMSGHAVNRSSSSSFGYTYTGSAPSTTGGGGGSGSGGTANIPLNESLPSLDEINLYFPDGCASARSTPIFGPEDELFEWNLNDIRLDIEPVADEILKKFPYLQFRGPGAAQYLHSLRPQKLQHFRLPHPLSERWQVFRINEENFVTDIDEESIVSKVSPFDSLDGGPLKFSNSSFDDGEPSNMTGNSEDQDNYPFVEFEKSPIAPKYRSYAEVVTKTLELFISENSASVFNFPSPRNYLSQYQGAQNSSNVFNFMSDRPNSLMGSIPGMTTSNRGFTIDHSVAYNVSPHSPSSPTYLSNILMDAGHRAIAVGNFLQGSEYFNAVHALNKLIPSVSSTSYAQVANDVNCYLVKCLKRDKEKKLRNISHRLSKCEEIAHPYQIFLQFSCDSCESIIGSLNDLRTKIWYMTEVRTSPVWNRARDIALALSRGTGGGPAGDNIDTPGNLSQCFGSRTHTLKRNSSTTSLSSSGAFSSFKRFTGGSKRDYQSKRQSMSQASLNSSDSMFAPVVYAGRNKLSDREAEATKKWLNGQRIQNFCTGEERIHRFSCEVDDLVKRVIGDALSGRRNRGQSLLTSSLLFRGDLWKLIVEVEGLDRSSGATSSVTGPYPSKASFYNFGNNGNGSTTFEGDTDVHNRRRSTDSISMEGFNPSHMRSKTSSSNHSDLARSYSLRGHKSRKSSPNLIDMFASSLDLSGKRMSSSDIHLDAGGYDRLSSSNEHLGHRRNRSLNEMTGSGGGAALGNTSLTGSEDLGAGPVFNDEANREEHDKKREGLDQFLLALQMRITSLVYTDIGLEEWFEGECAFFIYFYFDLSTNKLLGSETDKWLEAPIVKASIQRTLERTSKGKSSDASGLRLNTGSESRTSWRHSSSGPNESPNYGSLANHGKTQPPAPNMLKLQFPYEKAYSNLIFQLSVHPSPMGKLVTLYELVRLVVSSLSHSAAAGNNNGRSYRVHSNMPSITSDTQITATPRAAAGGEKTVSRKGSLSAMTSLSEAIATVEAKRISSGAFPAQSPMLGSGGFAAFGPSGNRGSIVGPNTDAIAEELRRVFKNAKVNCHTLFRDLQFIAAFVPSEVLDLTDMGKAFWDVSLAALSLKEEYLHLVTETASEIFKYSTGMISADMDTAFLSQWTLQDCAHLWSIASKEGDTEGQRELAIMHFSHPHIAPICVAPFTKLSDIFTPAVLEDYRINEDPEKLDPIRMSIIKHWMTSAAALGDNIASEYLSQQDFSGYSI